MKERISCVDGFKVEAFLNRGKSWAVQWWEDGHRRKRTLGRVNQIAKTEAQAEVSAIPTPLDSGEAPRSKGWLFANFAEAIKGRPHDEFSDDLRSMLEGVFFAPERRNTLGSIRLNPAYLPWQGYEMSAAVDRFNSVSVVVDLTPTGIKLIDITSQVE